MKTAARFPAPRGVACPYCFVDLDLKRVAFRCSGRPMAGKLECVPYLDPQRARVMRDQSAVLPPVLARASDGRHIVDDHGEPELALGRLTGSVACDRCGGTTSIAICPHCHSLLPEELGDGAVSFGVVGARNSGKTVLLALMEQQLMSAVSTRFRVSIDHPGGTVGLANDLVQFRDDMENQGQLPAQTQAVGNVKKAPSVYRWKWVDGPAKIISIYDTAGEDVANRDNAMTQHHLRAATAVILVIDPLALSENRRAARDKGIEPVAETLQNDVLDGLTTVLRQNESGHRASRGGGKITTPLAVVVTKMDAVWESLPVDSPLQGPGAVTPYFDDDDSELVHEHLKVQLRHWGGSSLVNKIEAEFEHFRFFAVSSLGMEPDYHNGRLQNRQLMPSRVLDPVLWVLHKQPGQRVPFVQGNPDKGKGR